MNWFYSWQLIFLLLALGISVIFQLVAIRLRRGRAPLASFTQGLACGEGFLCLAEYQARSGFTSVNASADFFALCVVNLTMLMAVNYSLFRIFQVKPTGRR